MLDDELIVFKKEDVESKLLSDRKEGPATDVISGSIIQIVSEVQLRAVGESQLVNKEKLLETMSAVCENPCSLCCNPVWED